MKFLILFGIFLAFAVLAVSAQADGNFSFNITGVLRNLTKRVQTIQESVVNSTRNCIDEIQNLVNISGIRKQINNVEERIQSTGKRLEAAAYIIRESDWLQERVHGAANNVRKAQECLQEQVLEAAENIRKAQERLRERIQGTNISSRSQKSLTKLLSLLKKIMTTDKEDSSSSSNSDSSDSDSSDSDSSDSS